MSPAPDLPEDKIDLFLRRIKTILRNIGTSLHLNGLVDPFISVFRFWGRPDKWWISNFLYYLLRLLLEVWTTVFLLAMLALLMTQLDQAHDFFDDFENKPRIVRLLSYASVFCCGLVTWFGTRLQFILYDILDLFKLKQKPEEERPFVEYTRKTDDGPKAVYFDPRFIHVNREEVSSPFIRYTPGILGTVPFFILIAGFAHAGNGVGVVATLALIVVFWLVIGPIQDYVREGEDASGDDSDKVTAPHRFSALHARFRLATYLIWLICCIFFLLTPFFEITLWASRYAGIIAIAFGAFMVWIWMLVFVNMLNNHFKPAVHLFLIIVFFAAFVYPNNNNHQIRVIDEAGDCGYVSKKLGDNISIDAYFHAWLKDRILAEKKDTSKATVHMYLVAAEGGGIRAAYWTAGVLAELERRDSLTRNIFAISGVSGGSVGAGFFVTLYRDFFAHRKYMRTRYPGITKRFMEKDFLSPLVTAGLGPDMFQKLLFFKVPSFDRARYLEDSWAHDYRELAEEEWKTLTPENPGNGCGPGSNADGESFNRSFDGIWNLKNGSPQRHIPVLFLNSAHVDWGRKAILTPLSISGNTYFKDVVDILEQAHRDIPVKTAVSISARFPGFTPPAVVNDPRNTGVPIAHYVDGGYVDNSGLETALGILSSLMAAHSESANSGPCKACADSLERVQHDHPNVEIHLIFIKNSSQDISVEAGKERVSPVHTLYEATDPARTFFNAWDNSLLPRIALVREFLRNAAVRSEKQKVRIDSNLYILELDRESGRMPLGWQLSASAVERINRQINLVHKQRDYRELSKRITTASASFSPAPSATPH